MPRLSVLSHLLPVAAMAVAIVVYVGIGTWIWNRRHALGEQSTERKAA